MATCFSILAWEILAWQATVLGVAKSKTQLSTHMQAHKHTHTLNWS